MAKMTDEERIKARAYCKKWASSRKPEQHLWMRAKKRAKEQGVPFTIEVSDVKWNDFCPALGLELIVNAGGRKPADNSPSLDKIIPELGYVPGNVIVVSHLANRIKSNATVEQLVAVAEFYRSRR